MNKFILIFTSAIVFAVSSCSGEATKTGNDTASGSQPDAKVSASLDGKSLYENNCEMCHGSDGQAGTMGATDLSTSKLDHAATTLLIQNGRNGMRAFRADFNAEQLEAVVKYIEGFRK